jgi:type I restriction enzyme S subunit
MSLPTYGEYKDSGIAWVGNVPEHWHVRPLLSVASERSVSNVALMENNLLSLSYGRIVRKDIDSNDGLLPESFETYQIVYKDDIVMRLTDLQNDKRSLRSAQVQERGIITSAYLALQPIGVKSAFLSYLFRAYDLKKVFYSMGGGLRQSMKFSDLKRMPVIVPPTTEQAALATFLDRETAKIDALIAEQEKLIALLAEKRQATISHAVTKGLNPNAPMKDSGEAWTGEVPAHWHIAKLGLYASVENGTTPSRAAPEYWDGGDIPWLASGEVNQLKITEASEFITAAALKKCSLRLLPAGTVVVGMIGQGKTRGMSAILSIPATINQNLAAICPGPRIEGLYILYLLHAVYEWLREAGRGGNQAAMNCEILAALRIPLPPLTEQRVIVDFVEVEAAKLDSLRAHAELAIALLKERRSVLIAAAVTGQIDVRGAMSHIAVASPEAIAA